MEGMILPPLIATPDQVTFLTPPAIGPHSAPVFLLPTLGDPLDALVFDYEAPLPLPPQPILIAPPTAMIGIPMPLDGTGSLLGASGLPITDYIWTGTFDRRYAEGGNVDVVFTVPGLHTVTLLVSDGDRYSALASVDILVENDVPLFIRGDVNIDGGITLPDALSLLNFLFIPGNTINCDDSADFNDDGALGLSDVLSILNYLFAAAAEPASPFPDCGVDPTDALLSCKGYLCP